MDSPNYLHENLSGKVLLLNAPPDTGKDFAAEHILNATSVSHREFKNTLHNIAMAMTGLSREVYFEIYNDRSMKEVPNKLFLGKSPRDLLIWISEDVCKPEFGERYFGVPAAASVDIENGTVFSDSGFSEEVYPIAERVGADNIYVVRFTRNGKTFEGDSRNFLQPEDCPAGVNFIDLNNDGCIHEFVADIIDYIKNKDDRDQVVYAPKFNKVV